MKRVFIYFIFLLLTFFSVIHDEKCLAETFVWSTPDLKALIDEGLTSNKEIKSIESMIESLKENVDYAASLPDPRIGIALLNLPADSFKFDEHAMTQKQLFMAQKFPWFGKLSLNSQQAGLKVLRQQVVLEAKKLELAGKIATTYFELGFIAKSQEINLRLTGMMKQIIRDSETRYATGRGPQQNIFQAQVELSKVMDEKIILEKKRRVNEDRVNEFLNRLSFTSVNPPTSIKCPDIRLNIDNLKLMALKQNPWLKVKGVETDQARLGIRLAKKDYWPDMDVKVAYGLREEVMDQDLDNFVSASVMMNLPLWKEKRQDKKLTAAEKNLDAAIKSYENLADILPHKIDALVTQINDIQKSYKLYKESLIAQAKQWAKASISDYEVGKVEFNTMINAQIRLLRFELQSEKYLFEIYQKHAELEELIGGAI